MINFRNHCLLALASIALGPCLAFGAQPPCATLLSNVLAATEKTEGLELTVAYKARLTVADYSDDPDRWPTRDILYDKRFTPRDMQELILFSEREARSLENVLHQLAEVEYNYTFHVYEMGDPPPRIPSIPEFIQLVELTRSRNQTPRGFFKAFVDRLVQMDFAEPQGTHARLAEVLASFN